MRGALRFPVLLFVLFAAQHVYAQNVQKEANIWYFGRFLGLDFNSGTAVALNDGRLNTTEGVATISDKNGNLLFYTDGSNIWNRSHQLMPNGTGLLGSETSTQSAVIVPKIGDTTRYYVFTVAPESAPRGLTYSIVNITLDNGNGDVEQKNLPLIGNVTEKVTAVRHCNNRDIWVLAHGSVSDIYYAFLVDLSGVNTTPVISHTGSVLWGVVPPGLADSTSLGYMKASPDGKRIAAAHWTVNIDVSDFDNATGVVSNSYGLHVPGDPHYLNYGVEFSPDSRLVYATAYYKDPVNFQNRNVLWQYDVTLATPAAVRASRQVISQNSDPSQTYAALQVAPDGKLYMSKNSYKHVAAIDNPNVYGPGCNYVNNAVQFTLLAQSCSFGLPTFVQSYFYPLDSFTYNIPCPGSLANFSYTPRAGTNSVLWNFGDPASGANNTSTQNNPVHQYNTPGTYTVQLIKFTSCGPDTLKKTITTDVLNLNLGPDTLICGGVNVLLNPSAAGSSNTYLWQDGSANPTFLATTAGLYWVEVRNGFGCTFRDSINVNFKPSPTFELGIDTTVCQGNLVPLSASAASADSYLWSTGATTPSIQASLPGLYWCQANKGGCIFRDSISITVRPAPVVNLGKDTTLCEGLSVTYDASYPNSTYLWQNGSTSPVLVATTSGLYWVEVKNNLGCSTRDSVNVTFTTTPVFELGLDTFICQGNSILLNASAANADNYLWSNGATTSSIQISQAGLYWCRASKGSCIFRDTISLSYRPMPVVNLGSDTTVCEDIILTYDASYLNSTYLWQNGSTNPVHTVTRPGTYIVQVTYNGCKKSDTVRVDHNLKPAFTLGPDQLICIGSPVLLRPSLNPAWQISWHDGTTNPTFTVTQPGTYSLTAVNQCGSLSDEVVFTRGTCKVSVPNAFSPNNDRTNDVFRVLGVETVKDFNLKIFNRWGQIVFETSNKTSGWDGRIKGMESPAGTYVYVLRYNDIFDPAPQFVKGTIVLIR